MSVIKNLPVLERPREKALRYGLSSLSDSELLAIFIGGGFKENNALVLSTHLLNKYGGLVGLGNIPISELKRNKGVKDVRSLNIAALYEIQRRVLLKNSEQNEENIDQEYLYNKYSVKIIDQKQECLFLIVLNSKKRIVYETTLSRGSTNSVLFSWTDINREIITHSGKYFYLIHNHTNDNPNPSKEDIIATNDISFKAERANTPLLDHLIISNHGYYSFKMKKTTISC